MSCHHFVRNALDSNDQVEVEAALFAAKQYATTSPMFSQMILTKVNTISAFFVKIASLKWFH